MAVESAREVLRTVTVLFCDLVGSTALGESLDPEALRRVLVRCYEVVSATVRRHGGAVDKYIGDAVVGVFGAPVVREDDALRAVRAAAELADGVRSLNGELRGALGGRAGDPRGHGHGACPDALCAAKGILPRAERLPVEQHP